MNLARLPAIQFREGAFRKIEDPVATERTFELYVNSELLSRIVASEGYLEELGAGFVLCEGIADRVERVEVSGERIQVTASCSAGKGLCGIGSSGGIELERRIPRISSELRLSPAEVIGITREIESELWQQTGGVHCAVLFSGGSLLVRCCDIGRHNTVDKVVGYAHLRGIDLSRCILGCSGRQPAGMVAKVARAGIPVVISRAASTDRGIEVAEKAGITLICFSRGDRFTCYAHPERLEGAAPIAEQRTRGGSQA